MLFLQHPRERGTAIGTARMAHLSLPGSTLVEGIALDEHPAVAPLLQADDVALLFPGPMARSATWWAAHPPSTLVVVDGTWSQARKVLDRSPKLAALPTLRLQPERPSTYRIRKEPTDQHLSTIEAVAITLGILEGDPARFDRLLRPFDFMVERQLLAQQRHEPRQHKKPRREHPRLHDLEPLLNAPQRAVLVHGEANAHSRDNRAPGAPELVQWAALRPLTGERFEALLKPRRRLGARVAERLGLDEQVLHEGEDVADFLRRWSAFLGDDAALCGWGPYSRDLLDAESPRVHDFVNLRELTARCFGSSPGGIERGALKLAGLQPVEYERRADKVLALLDAIFAELMVRAAAGSTGP